MLALMLGGCEAAITGNEGEGNEEFVDETDDVAPVIVHEPVEDAQPFGQDVAISATVTDEGDGLFMVALRFKNETDGSEGWDSYNMVAAENDVFTGVVPADSQDSAGMHYYIEATDRAQNVTDQPERGADDPYHFTLYEE